MLVEIGDQGGYTKQDLAAITRGLFVMMFGIWTQLHLNPGADDYEINTRAVRLFLQKIFPDTRFPRQVW
ncbi:MAG: hypothetical protein GY896_11085 [Gammaproteobacteria bacterium]|nr:hypothetical protein [Gammaproteobacteria bacterium]MCP4983357.1 hypothetical protein [Gammaproteobacteria bacterium]